MWRCDHFIRRSAVLGLDGVFFSSRIKVYLINDTHNDLIINYDIVRISSVTAFDSFYAHSLCHCFLVFESYNTLTEDSFMYIFSEWFKIFYGILINYSFISLKFVYTSGSRRDINNIYLRLWFKLLKSLKLIKIYQYRLYQSSTLFS